MTEVQNELIALATNEKIKIKKNTKNSKVSPQ